MSSQRYMAQIGARFLSRSQNTPFLTDYVTANGVFVRTDAPPQVMELLRIEFTLAPNGERIVLHGMVTQIVLPNAAHAAPGVEIAFFAKGGESGALWDEFLNYLLEAHPECLTQPVMLAQNATDQVRRAHPRVVPQALIQVQAKHDDVEETLPVGDISNGGMFIKTHDAFVVGSDLRVTLQDPRSRAMIAVDCIVRRRAFGSNAGIGVEFHNLNAEQTAVLHELMEFAGQTQSVPAKCEEVVAPDAPRALVPFKKRSVAATEDSWAMLDEGWPRT
jgi:Tfp pilus assembly protein PilZ